MPDRIICFGDIIDDIVVAPDGPIRPDTDTPSLVQLRPGGSAANTAAWLGFIGAAVDFVGVVGQGDAERHQSGLPGVNAVLREHEYLQTGRIVIIVHGERRDMLTDRGSNVDLSPDDVSDALLDQAKVVHITGHTLLNTDGFAGVSELIERCFAAGVNVSVSPGSAGFIQDIGVARVLDAFVGADLIFAGLEDGMLLAGQNDPELVASVLNELFDVAVVTRGSQGVTVGNKGKVYSVQIEPRASVDPTGAGDAFCAGFLDSWIRDQDPKRAADAGVALAARAVGVLGGRPT